jgi:aminopeptidase
MTFGVATAMADPSEAELREIAESLVVRSMRIGRRADASFEGVRVIYNRSDSTCEQFALMVEEACWRQGAAVLKEGMTYARERLRYTSMPIEALSQLNHLPEAVARHVDAHIFIGENDEPNWAATISDRLLASAPVRQQLRDIMDERRVRWVYFGWPLPAAARAYHIEPDRFRQIFFNGIRASFTDRTLQLCRHYGEALGGKATVEIRADDGTEWRADIRGRPVLVDDGIISAEDIARGDVGNNIPAGEAFVAPLETSAEGRILFPHVSTQSFGDVRNLQLEFREGRIVRFAADEGQEHFQRFLDANTGDKDRIAELGIGCNAGAEYTGGSIIIDEKIFGTIHVAIGNNTGAYHGVNRASSHLDMIKDMAHGELSVDGKRVMARGRPVDLA